MSELSEAIIEMRNMRESYDQLAGAAEAYNEGKTELAENITAKGIHASATETLPELAEKVGAIAQTQTILDGGEVMAAQQFGDGALWNLYQVLADMKTRFMGNGDYSALIVCEYYKGYDSLQLQGADGYYTCDGDLYEYASPNHVWHDADNGKANRWVAFLYRDEGARLDITNTAISPRSMYIGGHIGTIEYFVNGRLTELVSGVEETDVVDSFLQKGYTNPFNRNCVIRGVRGFIDPSIKNGVGLQVDVSGCIVIDGIEETVIVGSASYAINAGSQYIYIGGVREKLGAGFLLHTNNFATNKQIIEIDIPDFEGLENGTLMYFGYGTTTKLQRINIRNLKTTGSNRIYVSDGAEPNLIDIIVGEVISNIILAYWNPTNILADATKKAQLIDNIKNHILARVSDATGGTQLVFTVSTNMYNAIASETITWNDQTITLADAFLTKNWLLAGA